MDSEDSESGSCSKLYPNPEGCISSEADFTEEEEDPDEYHIASY